MEIKTSETSPIRVDFVEGKSLGLTFAPGKRGAAYLGPYVWQRDLASDLERLKEHYGVDSVVTLLEEHELESLEILALRDEIRGRGMKSHWHPIVDGGVPDEMGPFVATIRTILSALHTGERVVVHCRGGLGRAGTVAACALIALDGVLVSHAIELVREARPGAIENRGQEQFIEEFSEFWARLAKRNNSED